MTSPSTNQDRLSYLADAVCSDTVTDDELLELDAILLNDRTSHRHYLEFCRLHAALELEFGTQSAVQNAFEHLDFASIETEQSSPNSAEPTTFVSPPLSFLNLGDFSGLVPLSTGWPMAYLVATVVTCLGLLVCSHTYISQSSQMVDVERPGFVTPVHRTEMPAVGRITGMADCLWSAGSDPNNLKRKNRNLKSAVSLSDRFDIRSGLLEITYDTGAKVVLQGPVTYEVDSADGGYLTIGKLTARLNKRSEHATKKEEASALFAVRTPTATITDLGTEFGVEVRPNGSVDVHVFVGKVQCDVRRQKAVSRNPCC